MQAMLFSRTWRSTSRALALTALAVAAGAAGAAAAVEPELAGHMKRDKVSQRYPVILRLVQQPDAAVIAAAADGALPAARGGHLMAALRRFAEPRQAGLLKALQSRGVVDAVPLYTVNAVAGRLTREDIGEMARRDDVASIRFDLGLVAPSRRAAADPCNPARPTPKQRLPKYCREEPAPLASDKIAAFDPDLPPSPSIESIGVAAAWKAGFTGQGVTVAIVDTGVDARHPDLAGSFRGGAKDWFDVHGQHTQPMDRHGHGTQIAGLVTGTGASGHTLGVAPQAKWIGARLYNDGNVGRLSQIHRIMAWLLDPDGDPSTADAPQVVLNAWGLGDRPGTCDAEFAADIGWLRAAGMHVVFAAGNGGPSDGSSLSPANNPAALAVGALDGAGRMATYSGRGKSACDQRAYPDILAPGELMRTTSSTVPGLASTTLGTGTSFAAAVAAGELAVLVQARPRMGVAEREALLAGDGPSNLPTLARALGLPTAAQ